MENTAKQFRKRSAILSCLRQTKEHPSAEVLYQSLHQEHPDISLATVYRNLALFKNQGLITSLGTVNGVERFDGDITPHVHFVCSACGKVQDLPQRQSPLPLYLEDTQALECQVQDYQLMFHGLCKTCK